MLSLLSNIRADCVDVVPLSATRIVRTIATVAPSSHLAVNMKTIIEQERLLVILIFLFIKVDGKVTEKERKLSQNYLETIKGNSLDQEIVIPVRTDESGNYISHNLRPLQPALNGLLRTKRQTKHFPPKLFYFIEGFGKQFNLLLSHSTKFLGPLFKVYRRHKDGQPNKTSIETPGREIRNCLYSGLVKHQEAASTVALNVCKGLRGMIKTNDEEFLIEPLSEMEPGQQGAPMSHKLYRRSTMNHVAFSRGVEELNHTNPVHHQAYYCGRKRRYMPHKPKKKQHWLPDEFPKPTRQKRALHSPEEFNLDRNRRRNVETLVVVDKDMVKKHGAENVTTYVLTVFNMVAMLYQDSSIGNNISVVLVGLVLLEGDE
ncbi:A disintegrin and metalloproteinase with thrombospondin motifs 16-like, partial [Limulus polyphemus]|uniref:A disintegrin and metalloproteinase with thrombospondin motifs 16-like n=1 Tax=Limulus polyphemus TaxID=6850 RepID=A0ABM1TBJ5_LIMPO